MLKYFLILFLLFSDQYLYAQQDEVQKQAERTADSILKQFKNSDERNFETEPGAEQEKLVAAEENYMNEFLKSERDKEEDKKTKRYLQILLGAVFLFLFIISVKYGRRRKGRGVDPASGQIN